MEGRRQEAEGRWGVGGISSPLKERRWMNNTWPEAIERQIGKERGEGSQPIDEKVLKGIFMDLEQKMGVGSRNLNILRNDPHELSVELGILYPVIRDVEILAAILEAHLTPLRWWKFSVFPHPKTNRLIVEGVRAQEKER